MRIPLGTHDVVEREANQMKDIPNKNNIHVLQREPHRLGLHAEESKHRSANGKTKNRNPRAHDYRKRNRRPKKPLRPTGIMLPQRQGYPHR